MAVASNYQSVENYSDRQTKTAMRILDTLDRSESRLIDHYTQIRHHKRASCRKVIHIRIPVPGGQPEAFSVYMRDVSASGAGFIYPGEIQTSEVMVGIPIPGKDDTWFQGKIVRCKEFMQEGFWDFGVKFTGRLM